MAETRLYGVRFTRACSGSTGRALKIKEHLLQLFFKSQRQLLILEAFLETRLEASKKKELK